MAETLEITSPPTVTEQLLRQRIKDLNATVEELERKLGHTEDELEAARAEIEYAEECHDEIREAQELLEAVEAELGPCPAHLTLVEHLRRILAQRRAA